MIQINEYIDGFTTHSLSVDGSTPWEITNQLSKMLVKKMSSLNNDFSIMDGVAIHKTALIEQGVIFKGPIIINANVFIGAHVYLRGGVYIGTRSCIGPGCEIKSSFIGSNSAMAHFNFIGDSLIGHEVNMEAGAIIANHFNERKNKRIFVRGAFGMVDTHSEKFGALVGDHTKIGANAVLSPGTLLCKRSLVKRLELVDQSID